MNGEATDLKSFIHVEKGIIPAQVCDEIIQDIKSKEWEPHTWYSSANNSTSSEKYKELDIQMTSPEIQSLLNPSIVEAGTKYNEKYSYKGSSRTSQIMNKFSLVRFNRYGVGQIMRQHHDHIHSLFDGEEKGIPVLSFVLNLNEKYEGGDIYFWKDYKVTLGKGDIIMFPSLFMFPHGVTEVTKGTRYSGVCWAW